MTRSLLVCLKEQRGLAGTVFEILSVAIYPTLLTLPYCTMRLGLQDHIEAAASASHLIRSLALFGIAFGLSPNAIAGTCGPPAHLHALPKIASASPHTCPRPTLCCSIKTASHAMHCAVETILNLKIEVLLELALGFQDQVRPCHMAHATADMSQPQAKPKRPTTLLAVSATLLA